MDQNLLQCHPAISTVGDLTSGILQCNFHPYNATFTSNNAAFSCYNASFICYNAIVDNSSHDGQLLLTPKWTSGSMVKQWRSFENDCPLITVNLDHHSIIHRSSIDHSDRLSAIIHLDYHRLLLIVVLSASIIQQSSSIIIHHPSIIHLSLISIIIHQLSCHPGILPSSVAT